MRRPPQQMLRATHRACTTSVTGACVCLRLRSDSRGSDAAVLRLLRLPARLDIVPRGNVQCADYIGANASRDAASKFICSDMIAAPGRGPF